MANLDRSIFKYQKKTFIIIALSILLFLTITFFEEATASEGYSSCVASDSLFFKIRANMEGSESESIMINLLSPINYVTIGTNPIELNLSVTKKPDKITTCDISIDGQLIFTNLAVNNGTTSNTYTPLQLANGAHAWNVNCSSEEDTRLGQAYFNTNIPFTVTTDKETYRPNENVNVTVNSPQQATVDVKIPYSVWGFVRILTGSFPQSFMFSNTGEEGTYNITAEMDYLEEKLVLSKTFTVTNPVISLSFISNVSEIKEGESARFTSALDNATGIVNYKIDFGDGSIVTTSTSDAQWVQDHAFSTEGVYQVNASVENNGETRSAILNVEVEAVDATPPLIELVEPANGAVLNKHSASLQYKAYDKTNMKCYLYLTIPSGSGWGEKKLEDARTGVVNNSLKSVLLYNLSEGEHIWEVNCSDASDNSALSESRSFTISTSASNTETATAQEQEADNVSEETPETEAVISEINGVLKKFESFDVAQKEALEELKIVGFLEQAKKDLRMLARDVNNVKFRRDLDEEGKQNRTQDLLEKIRVTRDEIPTGLNVINTKEYVKYDLTNDIAEVSSKYLTFMEITLTDSQKERFIQKNKDIQSLMTVSTKSKHVELEFLSGDKKEITLIHKQVKLSNESYTRLLEVIPKDVAKTAKDITFVTGEVKVIEDDPILETDVSANKEMVYYVEGFVDLKTVESIDSILISDHSNIPKSTNFITGLAVFNTVSSLDAKWVVLSILAILIVIAYMVFGLDIRPGYVPSLAQLFDREEAKKIKYLNSMVNHAMKFLEKEQTDKASMMYEEAVLAFNTLSQQSQAKVYDKVTNLCNEIDAIYLSNVVVEGISYAEQGDYERALLKYEEVQDVYKRLPVQHQSKIYEKCNILLAKLNSADGEGKTI